jgi:3'-phosphoadenosine 5'-phosphosulfate sulfotransferase (PAPS reductase)/FAD synthetase
MLAAPSAWAPESTRRPSVAAAAVALAPVSVPELDVGEGIHDATFALSLEQLLTYDFIIVCTSGGKDSLVCLLHLLTLGVPRSLIELWHHDVDGPESEGVGSTPLMDWRCTRDYCRKLAAAFEVPLYFSWKEGGFEREMLRQNAPTAGYWFETPDGLRSSGGTSTRLGTRLKFPFTTSDLTTRWCSAYLKIMVCEAALRGQERFLNRRVLIVTGERADESPNRARYAVFERHRTDNRDGDRARRHVDHYRPVHAWDLERVWKTIELFRVNTHPAYRLGWGRVSCARCIFGSPAQWASARVVDPDAFELVAAYERRFGVTIHRHLTVVQQADAGTPYVMTPKDIAAARSATFDEPIFLPPGLWKRPRGWNGDARGPN